MFLYEYVSVCTENSVKHYNSIKIRYDRKQFILRYEICVTAEKKIQKAH